MAGDPVLVVGATGALRPAVLALVGRDVPVLALTRPGPRLDELADADERITPVAADFADLRALARALPGEYGGALLYCPTAPSTAVELLASRATGRVVHVLTSASADPARIGEEVTLPDLPAAGVRVLLGWTDDRRWHTPEEISAAALAAYDDGQDRVLGRVRPWSDRPG